MSIVSTSATRSWRFTVDAWRVTRLSAVSGPWVQPLPAGARQRGAVEDSVAVMGLPSILAAGG